MWRSLSGKPIPDILAEIAPLVGDSDRIIHIGTDSKNRGQHTDYVTVIALVTPGRGGRVYYRRERAPLTKSLPKKLIREAELSIAVAHDVAQAMGHEILVHVDANEDVRYRSSNYCQVLAGMVMGHGFKVLLKPLSWCATYVADHVVKEKHLRAA